MRASDNRSGYQQIVEQKIGRICGIGQNAADLRGGKNHGVGAHFTHPATDRGLITQIECRAIGENQFASFTGQTSDDRRTDHPAMTRNPNSLPRQGVHGLDALPDRRGPHRFKIGNHHLARQFTRRCLVLPSKLFARLRGIADKQVDFGGSKISWIDGHAQLAGLTAIAFLFDTAATPFNADPGVFEGPFDERPHGCRFAGCEDIVAGRVRLKHPPHALDIFPSMDFHG